MATVGLLAGAFGLTTTGPFAMQNQLNGEVVAGNTYEAVLDPLANFTLDIDAAAASAADLDDWITSTPGEKIVFGHSFGAITAGIWLHDYGPTSLVDPADLSFVFIGNSMRKYGGMFYDEDYAVPDDTDYTVLDIARQYDGFADWPSRLPTLDIDISALSLASIVSLATAVVSDTPAAINAAFGMNIIHPNYLNVGLDDADAVDLVEGNITYRIYPTFPAPLIFYPTTSPEFYSRQDEQQRPVIELDHDRPVAVPIPPRLGGVTSLEESERVWETIMARRAAQEAARLAPPEVRLWDGDMNLRGEVAGWRSIDYEFIENDTGPATLQLSLDHYLAKWVMDFKGRAKRNVIITIDKQGSRWGGIMDHYKVVREKGGDAYLEIVFKHDYEQAKHIYCWANPFLRPELQFPKLWIIFGPAKWCLLMTLFVNLFRLETSLWTLPDNPLDITEWMGPSFNVANWRNVVKPFPFVGDNSNLTIVFSRFKSWHDVAKQTLADAQLTVVPRRYLDGDPHPFAELSGELNIDLIEDLFSLIPIRHGAVVWDIVDNSGWGTETAFGGSLLTGLIRAAVNIASDGTTEGVDIFTGDPTFPGEYYTPNFLGTSPRAPHVVFEQSLYNGIVSSEFTYYEAVDTSFLAGGQSMPGVNEAISAGVNMAGDFATSLINTAISMASDAGPFPGAPPIDIPPLGGILDAVAQILYKDVFLAFMEVPTLRAAGLTLPLPGLENLVTGLGDFHYYERMADAERAFTLSALMAVRAAIWATRAHSAHKIKVSDAAPWIFGENGFGHFGIGSRVGTTVLGYPTPHTIFVERLTKARYVWDKDGPKGWDLEIGYREPGDPALKALDWIREINTNLGVLGIL